MNEEITVGFGLNTSAFQSGLRQADNLARQYTRTMKEMFTGVAQSFAGIISVEGLKRLADYAEQIQRTAQIAGVSTDFVQNFNRLVISTGGDAEQASMSLEKLAGFIGQALQNKTSEAAAKFSDLGIKLVDAQGNALDTEVVMRELADKIKDAKTATEATALAMDVFGNKIGAQLVPVLAQGSKGLDKFNDSIKLTGTELEDLAKSKQEFADMFMTITVWAGKVVEMFANLAKFIGIVVEKIQEFRRSGPLEFHPLGGGKGDSILGAAIKEYQKQQTDEMISDARKPGGALAPPTKAPSALSTQESRHRQYDDEESEFWKQMIEAYKKSVEVEKAKAAKAKETLDLQTQYNELMRKKGQEDFQESQRGAQYPTIEELANNRGPFNRIARQILLANRDQIRARAYGNIDRAEGDRQFANQRMDYLASIGVINPEDYERHLAQVAQLDTADKIGKLLDLAAHDGININKVAMGP